jgi:putative membrane protein
VIMFPKTLPAYAMAIALLATPVIAQNTTNQKGASQAAQTFVTEAANGGMFEVESSRMALQKATGNEVKSFAQRMVDDHGKANKELEGIAGKIGAKVPGKMNQKHQGMVDKLKGSSVQQFHAAYISSQEQAHKEAIQLFSGYANSGDNPELKAFASKTLPIIQEHAKHVSEMAKAEGSPAGKSQGTSGKVK